MRKVKPGVPLRPSLDPMKKIDVRVKKEKPGSRENASLRKGRSNKLVEKRNEYLLARYYYYHNFSDKRYDVILEQLSEEFYLSTSTIQDLVQHNMSFLYDLKDMNPRRGYFDAKWPHLVW